METAAKQSKSTRLAILGHRGIPNSYGGFETLAEELAKSLVGFGVGVTVYCRQAYFKDKPLEYKGARLVYLPSVNNKFLDTPSHTLISVLHCVFKNTADVLLVVNVGNAPFALLARLLGKRVIFNVDGLDWQRKKWGVFARTYLKVCSYFAKYTAHEIITDAQSVQDYYKNVRGTASTLIPYGTEIPTESAPDVDVLAEYGLEYKKYFTYVARFEPENNPLLVVKAHQASGSTLPLVMIGDNRYSPEYVREIKAAASDRVIFLGYLFGARYKQLVKNSLAYIRAAEVGGISPAVVEAMGRGVCVVANDKSENREPLSDTGLFYKLTVKALANTLKDLSDHPQKAIDLGKRAAGRAMIVYSWDRIAYEYFKVIGKVQAPKMPLVQKPIVENRKKRMLITGTEGMLGQAIALHFKDKYELLCTSLHPRAPGTVALDIRDFKAFDKLVATFRPDYIAHLAAMTNLEECERKLAESYAVNTLATKHAAQLATEYGAKLIYISTSSVFNGEKPFYSDNAEPSPANVYGITKQTGALMAQYYARDHLIVRLGWLMGGGPLRDKKFVAKIIEQVVAGKKELHALTDKSGSLSYTHDVAKNIELLLNVDAHGIYNLACTGFATRYEVAKEIVKQLGYANIVTVTPVDSNFFSHTFTTARSASECLVNDRLDREKLSVMRPWQEALADYLRRDYAYAAFSQTTNPAAKHSAVANA